VSRPSPGRRSHSVLWSRAATPQRRQQCALGRAARRPLSRAARRPLLQVTMLLSMLGNEHEAYWGCRYEKELAAVRAAIASNSPDPLESLFVWFGKMAMLMACQTISSDELALQPDRSVVLDLGCGNGFTCEVLHAMGFKRVIGSDYSSKAISLALVRPCTRQHAQAPGPHVLRCLTRQVAQQKTGSARALQDKGKRRGAGFMGHEIRGG
jgi:hypothetical protein